MSSTRDTLAKTSDPEILPATCREAGAAIRHSAEVAAPRRPAPVKEIPMKFTMLICGDDDKWHNFTPEEAEAAMKEVYGWFERWEPTGKIAAGGVELAHRSTAKTVRPGPDGSPVVTDGPYLELKEVIGGVVFLECDTIDEAVAIAGEWPMTGTDSIEVRPVMVR
jgi:hypothetical protein